MSWMVALLIARTLVVPVWFLAFALAVAIEPSEIETNRSLLLGTGLIAAAILLMRSLHKTAVSDGPQNIDVKPLSVTAIPPQLRRRRWTPDGEEFELLGGFDAVHMAGALGGLDRDFRSIRPDRVRNSDRPRSVDTRAGWLRSASDHPDHR
jgi:hypothetical protein